MTRTYLSRAVPTNAINLALSLKLLTVSFICTLSAEMELPPRVNLHWESISAGAFSKLMADITFDGSATVLESILTRFPERVRYRLGT